jgi:hypothetical protein
MFKKIRQDQLFKVLEQITLSESNGIEILNGQASKLRLNFWDKQISGLTH